jgi:predicted component of type VI protein secretion system
VPAAPAVDPIDEVTRRPHDGVTPTPRVQPRTWVLRPRTGADHVLEGATVVGRDPDATAHGRATPWRVDDPAFTVSKTHALVTLVNGSPWIEDLDSTHGVVIRRNGDEASIAPRTPTRLLPADVIVLGAFEIAVDAVA